MTTATRKAVNLVQPNLVGIRGLVYNDCLVDGRRSLKVTGWKESHYFQCQQVLRQVGYQSYIKRFYNRRNDIVIRLIVSE